MTLPVPQIIDPTSVPVLKWGVIGPGGIAEVFVGSVQKHTKQHFLAVASRTTGRAQEFADKFGIPRVHDSYEALVSDPEIDAIYIASHQGDHYEHAMLALKAGKHILVEKPITYFADQARELLAFAKSSGLFAMEAMWTRYLPQSDIIRQLIGTGSMGEPQLFVGAFGTDNRSVERLWKKGGGGIVFDMGIYPIAMAQQFMGNPVKILASGKVRPDGMDEESYVTLEYANGGRAQLTISGISSLPITAACSFDKAQIVIHEPFLAPSGVSLRDKEFYFSEESWVDETGIAGHEGLSYQATHFAKYVSEGLLESPLHNHHDTVENIRVAQEITKLIGANPF